MAQSPINDFALASFLPAGAFSLLAASSPTGSKMLKPKKLACAITVWQEMAPPNHVTQTIDSGVGSSYGRSSAVL